MLARRAERPTAAPLTGLNERLTANSLPEPDLAGYDRLLEREAR